MTVYYIPAWDEWFETHRTRELKRLDWVPIPTRLDGEGYVSLMENRNGAAYYGVWIGIVLLASKCETRGTLVKNDGSAHDISSISLRIRCDSRTVRAAISQLLAIGWLKTKEVSSETSRFSAQIPRESRATRKGRNTVQGKEGNTHHGAREEAAPVETPPGPGAASQKSAAPEQEGSDLFREFCGVFFAAGRALNDRDIENALRVWLNYDDPVHRWCLDDVRKKTTDGTWSDARHTPYPANYLKQTPWTRIGGHRALPVVERPLGMAGQPSAAQTARSSAAVAFAQHKGEL